MFQITNIKNQTKVKDISRKGIYNQEAISGIRDNKDNGPSLRLEALSCYECKKEFDSMGQLYDHVKYIHSVPQVDEIKPTQKSKKM